MSRIPEDVDLVHATLPLFERFREQRVLFALGFCPLFDYPADFNDIDDGDDDDGKSKVLLVW